MVSTTYTAVQYDKGNDKSSNPHKITVSLYVYCIYSTRVDGKKTVYQEACPVVQTKILIESAETGLFIFVSLSISLPHLSVLSLSLSLHIYLSCLLVSLHFSNYLEWPVRERYLLSESLINSI